MENQRGHLYTALSALMRELAEPRQLSKQMIWEQPRSPTRWLPHHLVEASIVRPMPGLALLVGEDAFYALQ